METESKIKKLRWLIITVGIVFVIFNIIIMYYYNWKIPTYLLVIMFLYNLQKYYSEMLVRFRKMDQAETLIEAMQSDPEKQTLANILYAQELMEDIKRMRRKEF